MNVAILGASDNPGRFSYKAFVKLRQHGHGVFPVSPKLSELGKSIDGMASVARLSDIKESIDTVTMYVSPQISSQLVDDIMSLHPRRVIFNPGSENSELQDLLEAQGVRVVDACTLVLLDAGEFDEA